MYKFGNSNSKITCFENLIFLWEGWRRYFLYCIFALYLATLLEENACFKEDENVEKVF